MSLDTFSSVTRALQLRCPSAGAFLSRQWVDHSYRDLCERRAWSFLLKKQQFLFAALYDTGTVDVTRSSTTVTGTNTVFTGAMVGRQFRLGVGSPIYTIATYTSATSIELDQVYAGATASTQDYQIYNAYLTVPSDFHSFISVIDPAYAWKLWTNVMQSEVDAADPQRASAGQPYIVSPTSYDTTTTPPTMRMEFWPHVQQQYYLTYLYEARATDLSDASASLPRFIRGDLLLEMALAKAAMWPGASADTPNPYFNLNLALMHGKNAERLIQEAERQDDDASCIDIKYSNDVNLQLCPWPFSASWLQSHSV